MSLTETSAFVNLVSHSRLHLASIVVLISYKLSFSFRILLDHISSKKDDTKNITGRTSSSDKSSKAKHNKSISLIFGHLILNTFMRDENTSLLYGQSWNACRNVSWHDEEHKLHSDWFACRISWIQLFTGRRPCKSLKLKEVISLDSPFDLLNLQLCSQSIWGKRDSVLHGIYLHSC